MTTTRRVPGRAGQLLEQRINDPLLSIGPLIAGVCQYGFASIPTKSSR